MKGLQSYKASKFVLSSLRWYSHFRSQFFLSSFILILTTGIQSQEWQYPGCDNVTNQDFRKVSLVNKTLDDSLHEPIELDLAFNNQGDVDIYFVERLGHIKHFNGTTGELQIIGTLPVYTTSEHGALGIALDRHFATTRWMYVLYHPLDPQVYRIERFTLGGDGKIDFSTRKEVFAFPDNRFESEDNQTHNDHTGGSMQMDDYGDLWISVGENFRPEFASDWMRYANPTDSTRNTERFAANTNSYKGSVLRIHPEPDGSYSIPRGNFGDYFAGIYPDRASEFNDQTVVLPEVYAKGLRNPYTLNVDPVRRWAAIGDCAGQHGGMIEEHNLTSTPAFFGWPYFTGENDNFVPDKDPDAPFNQAIWNTGLELLPPATPSLHTYLQACSMTGPIYRYDGDLNSSVKFPPHFDRHWFVMDWGGGVRYEDGSGSRVRALELNATGDAITGNQAIFDNFEPRKPIDMEQGPDGAMYVIEYSCGAWFDSQECTSIQRIEYTGNCHPAEPKLEKTGCTDNNYVQYDPAIPVAFHDSSACITPLGMAGEPENAGGMQIEGLAVNLSVPGYYILSLYNVKGEKVYDMEGYGPGLVNLPESLSSGIHFIRVHTSGRSINGRLLKF